MKYFEICLIVLHVAIKVQLTNAIPIIHSKTNISTLDRTLTHSHTFKLAKDSQASLARYLKNHLFTNSHIPLTYILHIIIIMIIYTTIK